MLPHLTPANIASYLIVVNTIAFCAFGIDKSLAEAGRWRISEDGLLLWALLGGTPGAYAGRRIFRHKTRKQPFSGNLHAIAVLQVGLGGGLAYALSTGMLAQGG